MGNKWWMVWNRGEMKEIPPKANTASIVLLLLIWRHCQQVLFMTVEKILMMTTLKCEELIELPRKPPQCIVWSFAVGSHCRDSNYWPSPTWLASNCDQQIRKREADRRERNGQEKAFKRQDESFGCSAILAYRKPKKTNVKQSLTSALPEQRER